MASDLQEQDSFPIVVVTPIAERGYLVSSPVLPGLVTAGLTVKETLRNLRDALTSYLEMHELGGRTLPEKYE